jgi:hypothetical protein
MGATPRQPGADTDAVLADFGFSGAEIGQLKDAGVVGAGCGGVRPFGSDTVAPTRVG